MYIFIVYHCKGYRGHGVYTSPLFIYRIFSVERDLRVPSPEVTAS
jgi:hypothetical protein